MSAPANWPPDADGDVFRRLEARNVDFAVEHEIDFNVDFECWPPHEDAVAWLQTRFRDVEIFEPGADFNGYIQFKLHSTLNYSLVVETQAEVSTQMQRYGGICETWGVMQPRP
jgi:hypothetical protein